jgi:hypothetical protein
MMHKSIISDGQALQILRNDLRRAALEKRAAELSIATAERRAESMAEIDQGIEQKLRARTGRRASGFLMR